MEMYCSTKPFSLLIGSLINQPQRPIVKQLMLRYPIGRQHIELPPQSWTFLSH